MIYKEFALSLEVVGVVREKLTRIQDVYDGTNIRFLPPISNSPHVQWITVGAPNEDICDKVKNYITSLTDPKERVVIAIPSWFKKEILDNDSTYLKDIQRESSTYIFPQDQNNLCVQGASKVEVMMAKSFIEAMRDCDIEIKSEQPVLQSGMTCVGSSLPSTTSGLSFVKSKLPTVACEIDEINQTMKKSLNLSGGAENTTSEGIISKGSRVRTDNISSRVRQFALKLGYDDQDIMLAASKYSAANKVLNEDTLLQELVKQSPHKLKPLNLHSNLTGDENKLMTKVVKTVAEMTRATSTMSSSSNELRGIVIDGSNVAMCHGHKEHFSCSGIEIVVNWFKKRGHSNIIVFVPHWRLEASKSDSPITNQEILTKLQKDQVLVFTPSRRINGRRIVCYDDRYIIKYAFDTDSVIVSNDNFRDLQKENPEWKNFVENRVLMYTFVNDHFMPPDDPLGRGGVNLDNFLKKVSNQNRPCPYKNYCTYGEKCRYYHPERDKSNVYTSNVDNTNNDKGNSNNNNPSVNESVYTKQRIYNETVSSSGKMNDISSSCHFEGLSRDQPYSLDHPYDLDIIARGRPPSANQGFSETHSTCMSRRESTNNSLQYNSNVTRERLPLNTNVPRARIPQDSYSHPQKIIGPGYYPPRGSECPPQSLFQQYVYRNQWQNNSPQVYSHYVSVPRFSTQQSYPISRHQHPPPTWNPQYSQPGCTYPEGQVYHQSSTSDQYMLQPVYPVHPQHAYSPQMSFNEYNNIMPRYINPHNVEQYNHHPGNQVNDSYNRIMSVETAEVQHLQHNQNYYLRSDSTALQDDNRFNKLLEIFPGRTETIQEILTKHSNEHDVNVLISYLLNER